MNYKVENLKENTINTKIYGEELLTDDFLNSIKAHGILNPLAIKEDGTIISGHQRFKAAKVLNITEVPVNIVTYKSELEEKEALINFNKQRIKTYSQMANEADLLKDIEAKKAEIRKLNGLKNIVAKDIPGVKGEAKQIIAQKTGFGSKENLRKYEKVRESAQNGNEKAQENIKKLDKGDITINKAYKDIKKIERKKEIESTFVNKKSESIDIYNTNNKYKIIYADPAWQYWESGDKNQSNHYKTMTINDICKLPIKNIADKDCILFLWVTFPILKESFEVMEAWGFKYSTCGFNWIKKNKKNDSWFFGCGSWTRANSELCLIATKGKIERLDNSISQILDNRIMEHSKKPEICYQLIEKLVGKLPRIELFARNTFEGWDCWGNEI